MGQLRGNTLGSGLLLEWTGQGSTWLSRLVLKHASIKWQRKKRTGRAGRRQSPDISKAVCHEDWGRLWTDLFARSLANNTFLDTNNKGKERLRPSANLKKKSFIFPTWRLKKNANPILLNIHFKYAKPMHDGLGCFLLDQAWLSKVTRKKIRQKYFENFACNVFNDFLLRCNVHCKRES